MITFLPRLAFVGACGTGATTGGGVMTPSSSAATGSLEASSPLAAADLNREGPSHWCHLPDLGIEPQEGRRRKIQR